MEDGFCPYCDELIILNIIDDYYFTEQNKEVEQIECPKCKKPISISWEMKHKINFNKVE